MDDTLLNDRLNAISGKIDIVLTRLANAEALNHDMLLRLAQLQGPSASPVIEIDDVDPDPDFQE